SGCGKTTTLKMVNRLVEPTSGRILIDGEDVTRGDPVQLRRRIGYVIQQTRLFPDLTRGTHAAPPPPPPRRQPRLPRAAPARLGPGPDPPARRRADPAGRARPGPLPRPLPGAALRRRAPAQRGRPAGRPRPSG